MQDRAVLQWLKLVNCIREVWSNNENVTIGIVGIARRTIATRELDRQRERVEDIWSEEIMGWQAERIRNKRPSRWMEGIDLISMERVIISKDVGRDDVHLNRFEYEKFYNKITEFMQVMQGLRIKTRKENAEKRNMNSGKKKVRGIKKTNSWIREGSERTSSGRKEHLKIGTNNKNVVTTKKTWKDDGELY